MTSINGVSGSSSIYGNKNVLSGLASGMDTEAMIENSVSGFKAKITALQKQQQMIQWKQDAYRSIIDKMAAMTKKYTSFSSSTNLFSPGFFNKAVSTIPGGANAAMVSATGKSSSEIRINAIKQLATASKYVNSAAKLNSAEALTDADGKITGYKAAGGAIDWDTPVEVSTISGTMTLTYGTKKLELNFGEQETYGSAEELAQGIRDKLGEAYITTSSGDYVKADTRIDVTVSDSGEIRFSDKSGAGNSVYISGASDSMKDVLGIEPGKEATSFTVSDGTLLSKEIDPREFLSGKSLQVTLDGVTKTVKLGDLTGSADPMTDLVDDLNESMKKAFGTTGGVNKVQVGKTDDGGLSFSVAKGSTLAVSSKAGEALGMEKTGLTTYLNTGKTLGELLGPDFNGGDLIINGVNLGTFDKDTAFESVLTKINSNVEAGVSVSYSKLTNEFVFTSRETGAGREIELDGGLAATLFGGGTSAAGQDAIFTATVNGSTMEMTRSSNVVDIDGMSVTLHGAFGYEGDAVAADTEAITFTTKSDSDKIVDAVKSFVDDYNSLVEELRKSYATLPATKSDGSRYEPLTDEDKADMSESAVKEYEEKVKQGILFGDRDLSSLYNRLRTAITPSGADGSALRAMGLTTSYSNGLTTLELDENKLREALESNPDGVRDAFTKTKEYGASTDGLMYNLKRVMDSYASTSVAEPGILVRRAGTKLSSMSLLDNTLQDQLDNLDDQIDKWQTKMSGRVDYYTRQFTALEQLMAQMNSQSSLLAGMSGGY